MRRLALFALAPAALAAVPACSSDPTLSSSGSSGGGVDCSFSGSMTGGVAGSIQANACGTSSSASFSITQADLATGKSLGVKLETVAPLKGGELGAVPLKSFQVFQREAKGAPSLEWSSTSCTLTLEKSESSPTNVFKNRYLLRGSGSCTAPLEPTAPNTRPAVTVSAFQMTAFIDPK